MYHKKKLMILGGSRFIIPLIKKAHELNIYVVTVDYLPDNIAHKYSDLYINESVVNKTKIFNIAKKLKIDGITSFACDPGVITAAYVSNKLGLPCVGPYESVKILQNKHLFRKFLKDNHFNVPAFKTFRKIENVTRNSEYFSYPVIVKPVDSCGSKGVSRVDNKEQLIVASLNAFNNSRKKEIIIEEFIEKKGNTSSSDCFSINGKLVFYPFNDQLFDSNCPNAYNPCGDLFPSTMLKKHQYELKSELQRLLKLLNMKTSIYNVESRVSPNGKTYLMEVSPRGGGNRIAEMEEIVYGFDYMDYIIKSIVGIPFKFKKPTLKKNGIIYVVHANKKGIFKDIRISEELDRYMIKKDIYVNYGDTVLPFNGSNNSFGYLFFIMDNFENAVHFATNINSNVEILFVD